MKRTSKPRTSNRGCAIVSLALVLAGIASACGTKGAVYLTITADGPNGALRIPDDVDAVSLAAFAPEGDEALYEELFEPNAQTFPLTLGIEPGAYGEETVRVDIRAMSGGTDVATADVLVPFFDGELTSLTVQLIPATSAEAP